MASKEQGDYDDLLASSGANYWKTVEQPMEEHFRAFRAFSPQLQQFFIRRLKHRKAVLDKDWFAPGITLVVVAATALVLASTTMIPYALEWRSETQELLKAASAVGLDDRGIKADSMVDIYRTTILGTAGIIAACAGLLTLWNHSRTARGAATAVWLEALEAEVATGEPARPNLGQSSREVPTSRPAQGGRRGDRLRDLSARRRK